MLKTMFNRLEELILLILDRTHKEGKADLSRFQMLKIIYLIQVYSLKYAGTSLLPQTTFIREKNGPISVDIYKSTDGLVGRGYIKKEIKENKDYGHERHCFSLAKKLPQLNFNKGELLFELMFKNENGRFILYRLTENGFNKIETFLSDSADKKSFDIVIIALPGAEKQDFLNIKETVSKAFRN